MSLLSSKDNSRYSYLDRSGRCGQVRGVCAAGPAMERSRSRASLVMTPLLIVLGLSSPLASPRPQPGALYAQENPQAKEEAQKEIKLPDPTNLQVLEATTGEELGQIMRTFTSGLGVECTYCHVDGDFANDAKATKDAARRMLRLTRRINAEFDDGKLHVSCFTCHRGETLPKTAPQPSPGS